MKPFSLRLREVLTGFASDDRANIAVTLALAAIPLVTGTGMLIDYQRSDSVQRLLQDSLDAATLASAATGRLDDGLSTATFRANFGTPDAKLARLNFTTDASGNVVGTATAVVATTFSGIVGVATVTVSAASTAVPPPQKITTATFKSVSAQGAFSKDIFLFTRNATGALISRTTVLTYRYSTANGGTKILSPATGVTKTISVAPYETHGVGLVIYQDLTYSGNLVNAVTKYSDDADVATWVRSSGTCDSTAGQRYDVEDGGDANFLDFVYTMTCTVGTNGSDRARLAE